MFSVLLAVSQVTWVVGGIIGAVALGGAGVYYFVYYRK